MPASQILKRDLPIANDNSDLLWRSYKTQLCTKAAESYQHFAEGAGSFCRDGVNKHSNNI